MVLSTGKYKILLLLIGFYFNSSGMSFSQKSYSLPDSIFPDTDIEVLCGTFRGNTSRSFYGYDAPSGLDVIWKFYLGEGETVISRRLGSRTWAGAGWTGQPLLVREGRDTFLIQGAYDHKLHKINAASGEEVWSYLFDDVVKSTGSIWENGVIETVGINDFYIQPREVHLAAISALDGFTYIVDHQKIDPDTLSTGPDSLSRYSTPGLITKIETGSSISSPVITSNRLLAAGYGGVYLYSYSDGLEFQKLDFFPLMVEASPIIWNERVYLAGRDGFLYCFGENYEK
jgi:outer membrane protein assembly factor BamB